MSNVGHQEDHSHFAKEEKASMTTQRPDTIKYRNRAYPLHSEPLEAYFRLSGIRLDFMSISTADIRGYQAEWEIADDLLLLISLSGYVPGSAVQDLQLVFPGASGPIHANWFTGQLRLQVGEVIGTTADDNGYHMLYEQELLLNVDAGVIRSTETLHHVN
jgi:hypothetical protein